MYNHFKQADRIRRDFPDANRFPIYINALCTSTTGNAHCSATTSSRGDWTWLNSTNITWISHDFYSGSDNAVANQADYDRYIFPYLRADQHAVLVPEAWAPSNQRCAACADTDADTVSAIKMASNTLHHLLWGMEDERVAAIVAFDLCRLRQPTTRPVVKEYYKAFSAGFAPRCHACVEQLLAE